MQKLPQEKKLLELEKYSTLLTSLFKGNILSTLVH